MPTTIPSKNDFSCLESEIRQLAQPARLGTEEECLGQSPAPGDQNSVTAVVKEKFKNYKFVFRRNGGGHRMGFDEKLS